MSGLYGNKLINNDQLYLNNLLMECLETDRYLSSIIGESYIINEANIIKNIGITLKKLWDSFKKWAGEMFTKFRNKIKKSNKENKTKMDELNKMKKDLDDEINEPKAKTVEIYNFNSTAISIKLDSDIKVFITNNTFVIGDFDENEYNDRIEDLDKNFSKLKSNLENGSILRLGLEPIEIGNFSSGSEIKRTITNLELYIGVINKSIDLLEQNIAKIDKDINKIVSEINNGFEMSGEKYEHSENMKKSLGFKVKLYQNIISKLKEIILLISPQIGKAQQCINHNINVLNNL